MRISDWSSDVCSSDLLPDDPLFRFAEAGNLRRNFQGYTTDQAEVLLGLGLSAIGTLPQGYAQNDKDAVQYAKVLRAGCLPVARGIALTAEDRLRRDIIQALMCRFAVDLRAEAVAHGQPGFDFSDGLARLRPLADEGLVRLQGSKVTVTGAGRRAVRLIAPCFHAYPGAARAPGGPHRRAAWTLPQPP